MKNLTKLFLGCLMIFAVASCKKGDDANGGGNPSGGSMSAKVDGKDWNANTAVQAVLAGGSLQIGGTGSGGQVNLSFFSYTGPKAYTIGGSPTNIYTQAIYTTVALPPVIYNATGGLGSGTVTITNDTNGYIEGVFSFVGKTDANGKSINVTDGKFKIKLK